MSRQYINIIINIMMYKICYYGKLNFVVEY